MIDFAAEQYSGLSLQSDGASVSAHNQSLIDQGFIEAPEGFEYMFNLHKEIRFSRIPPNTLVPRAPLSFIDLNQYQQSSNFKLSPIESETILRIDAIYNSSTGA